MAEGVQSTLKKLRQLYIFALSAIAISVIVSQLFIRQYLNDQQDDSRVVNVAGRQRMLSQKLTKELLLLPQRRDSSAQKKLIATIADTRQLWKNSHEALQAGSDSLGLGGENSAVITEMFQQIDPYFNRIYEASGAILNNFGRDTASDSIFGNALQTVMENEPNFLKQMDAIVNQYDLEAKTKVEELRNIELILMTATLLILLGELLFIFWPTAKMVKNAMSKLIGAQKTAENMARNADALSKEKDRSVRELRALQQAMDQTLLFARIDAQGNVINLGHRFLQLFNYRKFTANEKLSNIISDVEGERLFLDSMIQENQRTGWQGEFKATRNDNPVWLDMTLIPFSHDDQLPGLLVIGVDISKRVEAQKEIQRLNQKSFEERMKQQKNVSRKIIENQENEQNRIAKDLHDGIGQMLTGLKFNLESIDLGNPEKSKAKIENLKELSYNIIKGVRTATFNLTPPELSDHGIAPALSKLALELNKLTGKEIHFVNKSDFSKRLDSLVEINTYRIVQEAINNAIKYAESTHIITTLSHSDQLLSIIIDDNGKGFDTNEKQPKMEATGGMGMTFMKERVKYINGRLFVSSEPGKGTRITLNIPL
ncbi:MAG: ATP-binding protein [Leeuwenhoekiella sp.]